METLLTFKDRNEEYAVKEDNNRIYLICDGLQKTETVCETNLNKYKEILHIMSNCDFSDVKITKRFYEQFYEMLLDEIRNYHYYYVQKVLLGECSRIKFEENYESYLEKIAHDWKEINEEFSKYSVTELLRTNKINDLYYLKSFHDFLYKNIYDEASIIDELFMKYKDKNIFKICIQEINEYEGFYHVDRSDFLLEALVQLGFRNEGED